MIIDAATQQVFDRISERAADVSRAFTPGAEPTFDDVRRHRSAQVDAGPLCSAAPDDAYFICRDARGRTAYLRDGSLHLDRGGAICSLDGRAMLGFSDSNAPLAPLHIDAVDLALGRTQNLRLSRDGSVLYDRRCIDLATGKQSVETVSAGHLALARFPAATRLAGPEQQLAPEGVVPHVGRPADGSFGSLQTTERASSGIDFDLSLDRLHDAYAAFDALSAAHKAQGSVKKTTMDLLK